MPSYSKKSKLFTYVDTTDIKIHTDVDIAIIPVPQSTDRIILVRNVFQDPDKVRSIVTSSPIHKEHVFAFPGYRSALRYNWGELPSFFNYLLHEFYKCDSIETFFNSNVINTQEQIPKRSLVPHVDDMGYGFSIWLNTPDEINPKSRPGTAFYKNKIWNTCKLNAQSEKEKYQDYLKTFYYTWGNDDETCSFDSDLIDLDVWEKYFISPMEYNSMVLYPGYLFHQPYVKPNLFQNCERFALAGVTK